MMTLSRRIVLFAILVLSFLPSGNAATSPPKIILVMPDDVGYGDYACLGNPQPKAKD